MYVDKLEFITNWNDVAKAAKSTIGKDHCGVEPTEQWRKKILLAEHSPIRALILTWTWKDLMSWVSVHFVRHKIGIEHFVSTQRTDRTGIDRNNKLQSAFVKHTVLCNTQSLIAISRKRLCNNASRETKEAWLAVLNEINKVESLVYSVCVPECVYRGFCPEIKKCGYSKTEEYENRLVDYRNFYKTATLF